MLGDIILLSLCAENFDRASTVFTHLCKDQSKIMGVPNFEVLKMFLDACIVNQDLKKAMVSTPFFFPRSFRIVSIYFNFFRQNCVEYCSENGFSDVFNLGKKLAQSFNLGPIYSTKLIALLGQDVLPDDKEIQSPSLHKSGGK